MKVSLLFIIFSFNTIDCNSQTSNQRPVIEYEENPQQLSREIQRQENDTLRLDCSADYPIKWQLPDNDMYQDYSIPKERLEVIIHNPAHATLKLSKLRWTDTGFYRCVHVNVEYSKPKPEADALENRVYVYVKDSNASHLFLHLKNDFIYFPMNTGLSHINCKVTDITANVIIKSGKARNLVYERGFGFKLQPGDLVRFCIGGGNRVFCFVTCKTTVEGKSDELPLILKGEEEYVPESEAHVIISPKNVDGEFYLNNNVTISCTASVDEYTCRWIDPKYRNIEGNKIAVISIINLNKANEGYYTCTCTNKKSGKEISNQIHLSVLSKKPEPERLISPNPSFQLSKSPITPLEGPIGVPEMKEIHESGSVKFLTKVRLFVKSLANPSKNLTYGWYHRYSTIQFGQVEEEVFTDGTFVNDTTVSNDYTIANSEIFINMLTLNKASVKHSGDYILTMEIFGWTANFPFSLRVLAPTVSKLSVTETVTEANMVSVRDVNPRFLERSNAYKVWCVNEGYENSMPTLMFSPCISNFLDTNSRDQCKWVKVAPQDINFNSEHVFEKNATFQNAIIANTVASTTGTYKCLSTMGGHFITVPFIVTDIVDAQNNEGFGIESVNIDNQTETFSNSTIPIYKEAQRNLELLCKVQKYDYKNVTWYNTSSKDPGRIFQLIEDMSDFSKQVKLVLESNTVAQGERYSCRSVMQSDDHEELRERFVDVEVVEVTYPFFGNGSSPIISNFIDKSGDSIYCDAQGDPAPIINWFKDGKPYSEFVRPGITLEQDGRELRISTVLPSDKGVYTCEASNHFNTNVETYNFERDVVGVPINYATIGLIGASSLLALLVVALMIVCFIAKVKYMKRARDLESLQRDFMASSDTPASVQEDSPINEQPDCLPYNREYELPPSIIPLREAPELGRGQFGRVVESCISIRSPAPEKHKVAVKIIPTTKPKKIKSLLDEVKIMIYIGHHINILPFIGTISTQLRSRTHKLYIFTEYCSLGALDKILRRCRNLNSYTNELQFHVFSSFVENDYKPSTSEELSSMAQQPLSEDDSAIDANGYTRIVQSDWNECEKLVKHRCHSEGGSTPPPENICTSDLLFYCYQIANGMLFLFSRKVIHRDLATRNILITENNVVRICDFGLSQQGVTYAIKTANKLLPLKWLALEVLTTKKFSIFSDIWSFGIVLWEIFTLGQLPYDGYDVAVDNLRDLLQNGVRPPRPEYAPESVWNLMQRCWSANPQDRPEYKECKKIIGDELKNYCQQCHDCVQNLLTDPENNPDYQELRKKLNYMKDESDAGYENLRRNNILRRSDPTSVNEENVNETLL